MKFTVLIPVYHGDNDTYFNLAIQSIADQSLPADEIVLVEDGPLTDALASVVCRWKDRLPLKIISLPTNIGLGLALRHGVEQCSHGVVLRMDSDDIARSDRFAQQVGFLDRNPGISAVGGFINEFNVVSGDLKDQIRKVPTAPEAVAKFSKNRNPTNHMTVAFRREDVLKTGNYQGCFGFEDYDLWVRMISRGYRIANLPSILVDARVGSGMLLRRRGLTYLSRECRLHWGFYTSGHISLFRLFHNISTRGVVRLLPTTLIAFLYRKFLR